jgi:hypothetical protein
MVASAEQGGEAARRTRVSGSARRLADSLFLFRVHLRHLSPFKRTMGRPVEKKVQRRRRISARREDAIAKGVEAVENARRRNNKQQAAAILLAERIEASPATVYRRMAGGQSLHDVAVKKRKLFEAEEGELAEEVRDASDRRCPYRPRKIRQMAIDIIQARDPHGPEPELGKNWVSHFLVRHNIRTYRSKKISNDRSRSTNPKNVGDYFDTLDERQEDRNYEACHKYGMDESPGMLGNGDSIVVAGPAGRKGQYVERDGNRKSYTIVATICADGTANVAPWFIFKAKGIAKAWAENNSLDAT